MTGPQFKTIAALLARIARALERRNEWLALREDRQEQSEKEYRRRAAAATEGAASAADKADYHRRRAEALRDTA